MISAILWKQRFNDRSDLVLKDQLDGLWFCFKAGFQIVATIVESSILFSHCANRS